MSRIECPREQEVLDALHVRELLEPELVRLAAEALNGEELKTLQDLTEEMERAAQAGDRPAWSKADIKWHETLCNTCPNRLLGQMVLQARNRIYRSGSSTIRIAHDIRILTNHRRDVARTGSYSGHRLSGRDVGDACDLPSA